MLTEAEYIALLAADDAGMTEECPRCDGTGFNRDDDDEEGFNAGCWQCRAQGRYPKGTTFGLDKQGGLYVFPPNAEADTLTVDMFPSEVPGLIDRLAEEARAELAILVNRARRSISQRHRRHREEQARMRAAYEAGR